MCMQMNIYHKYRNRCCNNCYCWINTLQHNSVIAGPEQIKFGVVIVPLQKEHQLLLQQSVKSHASEALTMLLKMLLTRASYLTVVGGKYMDTNQAGLQCSWALGKRNEPSSALVYVSFAMRKWYFHLNVSRYSGSYVKF